MGEIVKFPSAPTVLERTLTVGDLRKVLAGHPDDMPVLLEIDAPESGTDLAQAFLRLASVEARCDEVDRLYLWGSYEDDVEMLEEAEKCTDCGSPFHTDCGQQ